MVGLKAMLGIATAPESRTGNRGDELQKSPCRPRPDADDQAPPSDRAYHGYKDCRLLPGHSGASFPHQVSAWTQGSWLLTQVDPIKTSITGPSRRGRDRI